MFLDFTLESFQEYRILRDYYISNGDIHGIVFVIENKESGEVKTMFLEKEDVNNAFLWKKSKKNEVDYQSFGVEYGKEESILRIEMGKVTMKKKFSDKTVEAKAKKYRFILHTT